MHSHSLDRGGDSHQNLPGSFKLNLESSKIGSSELAIYFAYVKHEIDGKLFVLYVAAGTPRQKVYDFICDHDVLGT